MNKKVTIQDIADALGISRNTVSKAINNSEGIAESTRDAVLQKAVEMGYKQFSYFSSLVSLSAEEASRTEPIGEIALFTSTYLGQSHFGSLLMDKIHREASQMGYTIATHRITQDLIETRTLPKTFNIEKATAILCIEIFDAGYSDMLCDLDIPILFVDGPSRRGERSVRADLLMMDNISSIVCFVNIMIRRGLTRIGFIGDYDHCLSFWERFIAYRASMDLMGITVDNRFIIKTRPGDLDSLGNELEKLEELPDVFICTNDFDAIDAIQLLAQKDSDITKKVRFIGFDDSHESRIFYPPLSTVHIHSQSMAYSALHLLVTRIKEPSMEYRTIYVATDLVLRESTEF